jgi:hypothetical protein
MFIVGLGAGSMDSWRRWPTGVLALVMFVACNVKCDAGEYLSKAKRVYHPIYGSLGALGLVLAVFARPTRDHPTPVRQVMCDGLEHGSRQFRTFHPRRQSGRLSG